MDYKEKIEHLKKSCYCNAPCEIDKERLEAAHIIEELIEKYERLKKQINELIGCLYCKHWDRENEWCNKRKYGAKFYAKCNEAEWKYFEL